ncbi:MAG: alpha/beta fold hydrolase [Candidatus Lokiarchaeota archaeon]|nr:alpha/beta fold hydrolase [Candidatus Lokiarchaeota archaeon]
MAINPRISDTIGDSPIRNIPPDYFPKGCGFWLKLSTGLNLGKKLFFRDSKHGIGKAKDTIVFVHGNPENSYTYRKVIKYLISHTKKPIRIIAMDHIGFGLSDSAIYEMVCMDHARNLLELLNLLNLKNVTLVIHDWGGPIGIGAFLKVPHLVSNLVILNSTVFPISKRGINYDSYPIPWLSWSKAPVIIPNHLWGSFAAFAIFCRPTPPLNLLFKMLFWTLLIRFNKYLPREKNAQKLYKKQFSSKLNALSSKRLVLQTSLWGHGNIYSENLLGERDTKPFYRFIQNNMNKLWGPNGKNIGVRAILGKWDPLGQKNVIQQWKEALPQLKENIKIFENAGHFVEELYPKEIAKAIINLIES